MSASTGRWLLDVAVLLGEVGAAALAAAAGIVLETDALAAMGTDLVMGIWYTVFGAVLLTAAYHLLTDARERRSSLGA